MKLRMFIKRMVVHEELVRSSLTSSNISRADARALGYTNEETERMWHDHRATFAAQADAMGVSQSDYDRMNRILSDSGRLGRTALVEYVDAVARHYRDEDCVRMNIEGYNFVFARGRAMLRESESAIWEQRVAKLQTSCAHTARIIGGTRRRRNARRK